MRYFALLLTLCLCSFTVVTPGFIVGGSPAPMAAVGSSDTVTVSVTGGPDIDPAPLYVRFEQGLYMRLEDTTTRILHPKETIDYRVIFTPPYAGTFSDAIFFKFINAQGQVIERMVPLNGIGVAADVREDEALSSRFYPNPASSRINFTDDISSAQLVDLLGNVVQQAADGAAMNVQHIRPGKYQLIMRSANGGRRSASVVIVR
jgi:hypothetical protein